LYSVDGKVNLDQYQMPPLPPTGMFDVRFGSNRKAENLKENTQTIEMRGLVYPVTVRAENEDIRILDGTGNGLNERLKSGEEVTITNSSVSKLMVSADLIPDVYALEQNYPNPFNPSTKIRYSIPNVGSGLAQTVLKVYDVLGNEVATLVNEEKPAGSYEVDFNASTSGSGLASGIYYYKIQAGSFTETKKMVLIK